MHSKRTYSIGTLMMVILLVAGDLTIVRALPNQPTVLAAIIVLVLPTINLLLLVIPRLRRSNPTHPYWLGFEVGGWLMVIIVGFLTITAADPFLFPIFWLNRSIQALSFPIGLTIEIAAAVLLYTPVQILPAVLAARLSARYRLTIRVAIVRRDPPPEVVPA